MEQQLLEIFIKYGWVILLIALASVAVLGIMKYCNAFKKVEEAGRHYIYLAISIGLSIIGTAVYLLAIKQFNWVFFLTVVGAMFALNQTAYNFFKITPVNKWGTKLLDLIKKLFIMIKDRGKGGGDDTNT